MRSPRVHRLKFSIKDIKNLFPKKIGQQIFIILVSIVVVPIIILGFLQINTSQKAVKTSVLRDHREIAIRAAGEITEFLNGPKKTLLLAASILGTLHADVRRQETTLIELSLRYPIFHRTVSIDRHGHELVTSDGSSLRDQSQKAAFTKAMAGEIYMSEVTISDGHLPRMTWAVPIKQLGQITNVLLAEVDLRGLWDIVDGIKIGTTGRAYLVDNEGLVIAHPDKKVILKNRNFYNQKAVYNVLFGKTGSGEETDQQGERLIVAYAPIHDMHWGIVIFQSQSEAYAFRKTMEVQSGLFIILGLIFAVMIGMIFSNIMSRPIRQLIQGTKRISRGNFDRPIKVDREDEMGNLIRAFNDMMVRLKQVKHMEKLSTIGRAGSTVVHALKNSLNLVNTYLGLLPERYKDKAFVKEVADIVPRELDSWKDMLNNMANHSKVTEFPKSRVNIHSLLEKINALINVRAQQNKIHFHMHIENNLPLIQGNAEKIKEVLLHLITNAFQVTAEGGSIEIYAEFFPLRKMDKNPYVQIQVKDTGKGILPEHMQRIFDPFFTTKVNGLGLGLSVCKEIVEYCGGDMKVSSLINKGTVFTLYFLASK